MPVVFDRRGNGLADLERFPVGDEVKLLPKKAPQLTIGDDIDKLRVGYEMAVQNTSLTTSTSAAHQERS